MTCLIVLDISLDLSKIIHVAIMLYNVIVHMCFPVACYSYPHTTLNSFIGCHCYIVIRFLLNRIFSWWKHWPWWNELVYSSHYNSNLMLILLRGMTFTCFQSFSCLLSHYADVFMGLPLRVLKFLVTIFISSSYSSDGCWMALNTTAICIRRTCRRLWQNWQYFLFWICWIFQGYTFKTI